jgi:uncharacterized protein
MKPLLGLLCCLIMLTLSRQAFAQKQPAKQKKKTTVQHPPLKMKQYFFVMLTKGSRRDEITDTTIINKLQDGHMANIKRLYNMGKLIIAGPFGDDSNWRGIFIFDCGTKEEVEGYLETDPAIAAGRLGYEIHPWWTQTDNCTFK